MLQLGFNSRELKRIQQVAQQYAATPGVAFVDAQQASTIANLQLTHSALHFSEAGWVQPQLLCERLTQHKNIDINTNTVVSAVIKTANGFEVQTNTALLKSDLVIIANAGSATQLVPQMLISTQCARASEPAEREQKYAINQHHHLQRWLFQPRSLPRHALSGCEFCQRQPERYPVTGVIS